MELRSPRLRDSLVSRVPDQYMSEPKGIEPGEVRAFRTNELLADERREAGVNIGTAHGRKTSYSHWVEDLSDYSTDFDQMSLMLLEPLKSGGE